MWLNQAEITYTGVLMVAESNYDMRFDLKSTFDPKIQDGRH